ncbi:uncharacterized methyltransferase At1g78140, chloroplastic isoform X2 [Trifolium pratense]|uniref:uncharacterized methyltransferase At1g78140, chloroplastic isoform X2 n=1 Tax=Trifolium pratense TaxID=57577 RepID=UPI001E69425E|nr:uncharacterized methyltransferase At1g78140, chloroplastic isoform X2 [Trifolium pratense]
MVVGIAVTTSIYTLTPPLSSFRLPTRFFSPTAKFPLRLRASSSTTFLDTNQTADSFVAEKEITRSSNPLACPVCYNSLTWITHPALSMLPLVSFLYERGWRQTFSVWGGFPGPEKEFELMKGFLKPVLGGNIIDASCGSGLFSRLFAKSGLFSLVVALDYSENMLRQCYEFVQQEDNFPKENFILVRADIARLPFVSSSVDAVHAGAAIHCWPSPSAAVAEISRVLRPGGVFVATTYILDGPFRAVPFLNTFRQSIRQLSGIYTVLSERELEALCKACGLVRFKCIRNGLFVMISATKPK